MGSVLPERSVTVDPFNKVPKKLPKIYFNDGAVTSCVWYDPEIGSEEGKKKLVEAIQKAREAFFGSYFPPGVKHARTKRKPNRLKIAV